MWKVRMWSVLHAVRLELRRLWPTMTALDSKTCLGLVLLGKWSSGHAIGEWRRFGQPDRPVNENRPSINLIIAENDGQASLRAPPQSSAPLPAEFVRSAACSRCWGYSLPAFAPGTKTHQFPRSHGQEMTCGQLGPASDSLLDAMAAGRSPLSRCPDR